jgi:hypothetical protein
MNTFSKALLLFFALVNLRNAHSRNVRPKASCRIFQPSRASPPLAIPGRPLLALVLTWLGGEGWDEIFARRQASLAIGQQSVANQRETRESYLGSGFVFIREIRGKFF